MTTKKKIGLLLILFLLGTMILYADLADNITVDVRTNFIEVRNYNDVPVTVYIVIEYSDGNFTRYEHINLSLGRKGFSSDTKQWSPPRGSLINNYTVKSVKKN